jgi:hypothetical protein
MPIKITEKMLQKSLLDALAKKFGSLLLLQILGKADTVWRHVTEDVLANNSMSSIWIIQ